MQQLKLGMTLLFGGLLCLAFPALERLEMAVGFPLYIAGALVIARAVYRASSTPWAKVLGAVALLVLPLLPRLL